LAERCAEEKPGTWRPLDLVRVTTGFFERHGVDAPRLCAERLLAHVLGCQRIDLYTRFERPVPVEALDRFRGLVRRRASREPIQHLVGETEFWSLPLRCDGRAFVPRPETELLVDATLEMAQGRENSVIADVGTGTGCLAIAVAVEVKDARVVASDVAADALELAAENLEAHELAARVTLLQGDLAAPFLDRGMAGAFDVVLCNPPYVPEPEIVRLQPEVRDYDPRIALAGGADGLEVIRRLLEEIPPLLQPDGCLIFELGEGQAGAAREMMARSGWKVMRTIVDGIGVERVIVGQRVGDG